MVTVVVFEFSVMRCQPLRRALCVRRKLWEDGTSADRTVLQ
ncbi:acetyltransferase [Vibrio tarriae]|nr:acetyltransferase [Vibrio tarriae]